MRIHCLQSAENEGPGVIADWAGGRGFSITTSHLYRGDPLPEGEVDLLVIMGGPMNIYQDRDYPWLKPTRQFIKAHVDAGQSAIGICLGSQFLADALGGRVTQNPYREIGWFPVHFTPEARAQLPVLPESIEAIHWHGDTFELPAGAVRLGHSEACANQGFLYENRVLALQFHPEMTRELAAALAEECRDEVQPGRFVQTGETILSKPDESFAATHELLRKLLDSLFLR